MVLAWVAEPLLMVKSKTDLYHPSPWAGSAFLGPQSEVDQHRDRPGRPLHEDEWAAGKVLTRIMLATTSASGGPSCSRSGGCDLASCPLSGRSIPMGQKQRFHTFASFPCVVPAWHRPCFPLILLRPRS